MPKSIVPLQLRNSALAFLLPILFWMIVKSPAESFQLTTQEQINTAKQIYHMEEIAATGNSEAVAILENYLDAPNLQLARVAARQLINIGTDAAKAALNAHHGEGSNVSVRVGLAKLNASSKQEAINNLLLLLSDPDITPGQRTRLEDEIAFLFSSENWHEELSIHFKDNPLTTYSEIRSIVSTLSFPQKKQFLENTLLNFNTPFEYEAAIRLLQEEILNDEIPYILEMLNDSNNIPDVSPAPFENIHTKYYVLMMVVKCIPDQRSIPVLTELSLSGVEYVSKMASEALLWVKGKTPYPMKYHRLLIESDES